MFSKNHKQDSNMKFIRDKSFDSEFVKVEDSQWFPYVGSSFGALDRRVMVYAHNIPVKPDEYETKRIRWSNPATWADAVEEYAYVEKAYTKAFRFFVRASVGLTRNFNASSDASVISRVDDFLHGIAYLNFIQGLVRSEKQLAIATSEQVKMSQRINREYLRILNITHCICWGKPTYEYVTTMQDFRILSEQPEGKKGFSSCLVQANGGQHMHILRVFHPSMPSFAPNSESTHKIISGFLAR
jgi:hypothetical protein